MRPKRTVDEIIMIAKTERAIVDIFCEGPLDVKIVSAFLKPDNQSKALLYAVDQIDWPDEVGRIGGNRAKIVYLSQRLCGMALKGVCVIDQDLDTIENKTITNDNLLKTDYSCMECYGLSEGDLLTFLHTTFNVELSSEELKTLFDACKHLFVIRFLRDKYCEGASIPGSVELIDYKEGLAFSVERYLGRCKQINGYDVRWDRLIAEEDGFYRRLIGDTRMFINIHDLGCMIAGVIRLKKSRTTSIDPQFLERYCAYLMIARRIFAYPLFEKVAANLEIQ